MRTTLVVLLFCLLGLFSACSQKESTATPPAETKPEVKVDPTTAGSISGVVHFQGTAPKQQKIDMTQDPACGNGPNYDESLVVNNGNLANVFVFVKSGLFYDVVGPNPPGRVVITQKGCRYEPHVSAARVGQRIEIVNADDTTHNIHPMPTASKQWNESQLPKAEPIVKTFNKPELMIPIKCNQHAWMRMYLNVVENPFFAVSGPDGTFEINGLPPGEYTLAAVHEKLGEQDIKVTVGPKETKSAEFTFRAQ